MSWSTLLDVEIYLPFQFTSWYAYMLYAPLLLLQINVKVYLICFLGLLLFSVLIKANYISAVLIFWFSASLSRFMFPILNGSDLVLNLFLIIAIFLPAQPRLKPAGIITQEIISSVAFLFARITLCLIYFLSGYDKLDEQRLAIRSSHTFDNKSGLLLQSIVCLQWQQNLICAHRVERNCF